MATRYQCNLSKRKMRQRWTIRQMSDARNSKKIVSILHNTISSDMMEKSHDYCNIDLLENVSDDSPLKLSNALPQ